MSARQNTNIWITVKDTTRYNHEAEIGHLLA